MMQKDTTMCLVIRAAIVAALVLALPALGDIERRPPTSIAKIAEFEGVKVRYQERGGMYSITIRLDPKNGFMGANNGTFARLRLKDASGELVGIAEIRNRFDFPDGSIIGPVDGSTSGRSLYIEFSCSGASIRHSEIYFYNKLEEGSPSQTVSLRDLLQISEAVSGR